MGLICRFSFGCNIVCCFLIRIFVTSYVFAQQNVMIMTMTMIQVDNLL